MRRHPSVRPVDDFDQHADDALNLVAADYQGELADIAAWEQELRASCDRLLFTLAGETLSAIGRMIERPAFNDEAAEQFLGGRWESDGPDAADVLADFEERVEVFEPPLIPDLPPPQPPRLVDRREPPATPGVVEAPAPTVRMPRMLGLRLPGPHPGASSVSQPASRRSAGEAVGAVESSSSGDGADAGRPAQRIRPAASGSERRPSTP